MKPDGIEIRETLRILLDHWGRYHDHKETMAYNATIIQLTLLLGHLYYALTHPSCPVVTLLLIATTIITSVVALLFVDNQLHFKSIAADATVACEILLFKTDAELSSLTSNHGELEQDSNERSKMPNFIAKEMMKQCTKDRKMDQTDSIRISYYFSHFCECNKLLIKSLFKEGHLGGQEKTEISMFSSIFWLNIICIVKFIFY